MQRFLLLSLFIQSLDCYFNIYSTNRLDNNETIQYDCLRYYVLDNIVAYQDLPSRAHQIISYCLYRIDPNNEWNNTEIDGTDHYFIDLARNNVTSNDLITWSASIDVVERYEMYIKNNFTDILSLEIFYECTWPRFGKFCQYSFELSESSVADVVRSTFVDRLDDGYPDSDITNGTCFIHLDCYRGPQPACLDWREICDGKIDCKNGEDEMNCTVLEMNECSNNEYRCRNGQCIPEEFLWDDILNPDCLDRTDIIHTIYPEFCTNDPSFRCEEHSCRQPLDLACGDGSCGNPSSCYNERNLILLYATFSRDSNPHLSFECWKGIIFVSKVYKDLAQYRQDLFFRKEPMSTYASYVKTYCPALFLFPMHPVMFGHVYFIYSNESIDGNNMMWKPKFICYNKDLCDFLRPTMKINGLDCTSFHDFQLIDIYNDWTEMIEQLQIMFHMCGNSIKQKPSISSVFQCFNSSKFITKHYLMDSFIDCPHGVDELFNDSCSLNDRYRFACPFENKCISPINIRDGKEDCMYGGDEENWASLRTKKSFSFQLLCDGIDDHLTDTENETDETHCEDWPCDNQYTHCNGGWNCLNGADETDCGSNLCPPNTHACVSPLTYNLTCLSLDQVNDGMDDCFGGADERSLCRKFAPEDITARFRCLNVSFDDSYMCIAMKLLCDGVYQCQFDDDEIFCDNFDPESNSRSLCDRYYPQENRTDIQNVLCNLTDEALSTYVYFFVHQSLRSYLPITSLTNQQVVSTRQKLLSKGIHTRWYCNRGLLIYEGKLKEKKCLCPPAYYGSNCEFQNQRVSLTIQFQKESSPTWNTIFHFFIFLMENNEHINSYEEIIYIPSHDCKTKFNINLLYLTKPKDLSKNYSIRIDAFNKHDLTYHSSSYLTLQFPFLPVNRASTLLFIPSQPVSVKSEKCSLNCGSHGQCMYYVNRPDIVFCQCDEGWSGTHCNQTYVCDCSSSSSCIGTFSNRSICLCSLHVYGPRCYIPHNVCKINPCQHGGLCIPTEERGFFCICPNDFSGFYCEHINSIVNISFSNEIEIPQSILIHLITVSNNSNPTRITMFKKILFDENIVSLSISNPIDVVFVEFKHNYYLTKFQQADSSYFPSILLQVTANHRCISISTLLNTTILDYPLLHRIKFYHKPCQSDTNLKCMYDESYLCLCNEYNYANCFEFNHNMKYNCLGSSYCENDGECFQDDPVCPKSTVCFCTECFYGNKCQFSNKAFGLSLDGIIGYHIRPKTSITKQTIIIKMTVLLTVILVFASLINSFLSILTFCSKEPRKAGCGFYLLASSISSLMTIILLIIKVSSLLMTQIGLITNRNFLLFNCITNDFLLKVSINFGNWINACVSIERCITVIKSVKFDQLKSRKASKWLIIIVLIFTVITFLHDPINRSLITDVEDQRLWCISVYSSIMQIFTSILNLFHFFVPFLINIFSTIIIIIQSARQRSAAKSQVSYKQHLYEQFQQCKHILISAILLVILALPNLIISFLSGCMKSSRNPWIYFIGYFISFIPSILIFPVFVLPPNTYKQIFIDQIKPMKSIFKR